MEVFVHHLEFATALEGGLEIVAMKVYSWGTMLVVLVQEGLYIIIYIYIMDYMQPALHASPSVLYQHLTGPSFYTVEVSDCA